jgi:hypothetical protein
MKIAVNLKDVAAADLVPEGARRARIARAELYPKDANIDPATCEIVGKVDKNGNQAYAWIRAGFVLEEHPTNYGVGPSGKTISYAGRWVWSNFFLYPDRMVPVYELFQNSGAAFDKEGFDPAELIGKVVDAVVAHKPRQDDPETKEAYVKRVRIALDK